MSLTGRTSSHKVRPTTLSIVSFQVRTGIVTYNIAGRAEGGVTVGFVVGRVLRNTAAGLPPNGIKWGIRAVGYSRGRGCCPRVNVVVTTAAVGWDVGNQGDDGCGLDLYNCKTVSTLEGE